VRRIVLILSLVLAAVFAPAAWADETIRAAISNRYTNPSVSIDQGEPLNFTNGDTSRHDVTASDLRENKPLFSTPLLGQNQTAFVEGSQYLTTGSYAFFCTVHPFMTGSLTVTSAGTPVPRPGGGADTVAPVLSARVTSGSRRGVRRSRAISVRVTSNEAVSVSARATARGRTIASGSFSVDEGASRTGSLKLNAAGRSAAARRRALAVTVRVTATDAAGNRTVKTVRRTIR